MVELRLLDFFSINQPRRQAVLRQILKNKVTSSSIYWGLRYNYLSYLNVFPELNEKNYDQAISQLIEENYLSKKDNKLLLTIKGQQALDEFKQQHYFIDKPQLFNKYDLKLWKEILRLMIQVLSELSFENRRYYVVSQNLKAQFYIKKWLYQEKRKVLIPQFKEYLLDFLESQPKDKSDIFMNSFVGHGLPGYTIEQLSEFTGLATADIQIIIADLSLKFADYLNQKGGNFSKIVNLVSRSQGLPASVEETYTLLQKGFTVEKIKQIRRLKESTIQEHLIIASILSNNFDYHQVLTSEDYRILQNIYSDNNLDGWKYQDLELSGYQMPFYKFRIYQVQRSKLNNDRT